MDREKVVKALECLKEGSYCECCNYKPYDDCIKRVATDAIALLKEQEAISPSCDMDGRYLVCGNCGKKIGKSTNYCTKCGRAVKWE